MSINHIYACAIGLLFLNIITITTNMSYPTFSYFVCGLNTFFIMLSAYKFMVNLGESYEKGKKG